MMRLLRIVPPVLALVVSTAPMVVAQPAQFVIVNLNAPGVGFNDPTPVAPVGGNTGITIGEQRLIAFQYAASLWAQRLNSPVPIRIRAQFTALGAGVLGSAGPASVSRDFPNAPLPGTWYHAALANSLAGVDLLPANDDINTNFSSTFPFYLGLDNKAPAGQPDLVAVLLHEFAHGLGFSQFSSLTTGRLFGSDALGQGGYPDAYNSKLFDLTLGTTWNQMTNAERLASATRFARVVWDGAKVTAGVPSVLSFGSPEVKVLSPAAIAGVYQFGTAGFGPRLGNPNIQASVVAAEDPVEAAGATTTDGCSPFTNAAAVAGNIALIERGTCGFAVKARNATNAGASAVIVYNNAANVNAGPPGMGDDGINGAFVTVPTVSLRRADGLAILTQLPNVTGSLAVDQTVRAGASADGRTRAFAPFPVQGGSSISHYDTVASRNLLMEPSINADLTHRLKAPDDLTSELMYDVGWKFPDADGDGVVDDEDCAVNSDLSRTIVIGGNDSGVPNTVFADGCTMSDLIAKAKAGATNHGGFVSGVAALTNLWRDDALMSGADKGAVQNAAARTNKR